MLSLEYLYRAVRTARGDEVARLVVRDRVDGLPHLRSMHLRPTEHRADQSGPRSPEPKLPPTTFETYRLLEDAVALRHGPHAERAIVACTDTHAPHSKPPRLRHPWFFQCALPPEARYNPDESIDSVATESWWAVSEPMHSPVRPINESRISTHALCSDVGAATEGHFTCPHVVHPDLAVVVRSDSDRHRGVDNNLADTTASISFARTSVKTARLFHT